MVERVLCKHEVVGSIPSDSTTLLEATRARAIAESNEVSIPAPRVLPWPSVASDIVN